MDKCNHWLLGIAFVVLGVALTTSLGAAGDECPRGLFETDLAEITRSFDKPDTRLEQKSLPTFGQAPPEISWIRSGLVLGVRGRMGIEVAV
jgi:hypothetical protein